MLGVADKPNVKSPDATRNGIVWEFKIPEGLTVNAIDKALRDGSRQAAHILIKLPAEFDRKALAQGIYDRVQRTTQLLKVAVLLGETFYSFNRQQIISQGFREVLA